MEITTDVYLRGPVWADTIDKLKGSIFDTQWGIYAISVALGIMYDKTAECEDDEEDPRYVPRNVLQKGSNVALLELLFRAAILTTRTIDLSEDDRLNLAFGEEKDYEFKRLPFLTSFANYGVQRLAEQIAEDGATLETMENLMAYLNDSVENLVEPEFTTDDWMDLDNLDED